MRIIAHEMPDGSVQRTSSFEMMLAWLQAGRKPEDINAFVVALLAKGASEQDARRLVGLMQDPEREIKNRGGTPLAREWAYALRDGGMTEASALNLIARNACPDAVRHVVMENPVTEANAPYRAALRLDVSNAPGWDMPKAREIHKDKLRKLRAPKLSALDVDYMRADEAGDGATKAIIAAKKKALRDVTIDPAIEAAATPEALAAVIPAVLK